MKLYIINMKDSLRRRKAIEGQLKCLMVKYEFVESIDARKYTQDEINSLTATPDSFTGGQVGCMLSHCKVYERMQKENDKYAIILEDDSFIIEKLFAKLCEQVIQFQDELDELSITLLTYSWCRDGILRLHKEKDIILEEREYLLCNPEETWGIGRSGAYIISKYMAQQLYDFNSPKVRCHADAWVVYVNNKILNRIYCLYPMPIIENVEFGSEIVYTKNKVEKAAKMLVEKIIVYNIPILAKLVKERRRRFSENRKKILIN